MGNKLLMMGIVALIGACAWSAEQLLTEREMSARDANFRKNWR